MSKKQRFNPAPGWPQPPDGWVPPAGWQPDPSWPVAPEGWALLVDDGPEDAASQAERRAARAKRIAGAIDPAYAQRGTSLLDARGGVAGRLRDARREMDALTQRDGMLASLGDIAEEQRETNRLLRALVERGQSS